MRPLFLSVVLSAMVLPFDGVTATISENPVQSDQPTYYQRHAEGWYWYIDPEQEEPPEEKIKLPEPVNVAPTTSSKASVPEPFSAQWVRDMLPRYMDLAWSNPTPENVRAYFMLQRFAVDRSQKFADVAQRVVIGNPYLDETNRRPLSSFGIPAVDREAGVQTTNLLKRITTKAGIFFFFKGGCQYCELQAPVIKVLENFGFDVLAISIDGAQLASAQFENTRLDSGHAAKLGVTATPALFLVSEQGGFSPLGQGLLSLDELRKRILIVAAREKWITEKDFDETRPLMVENSGPEYNLSEKQLAQIADHQTGESQDKPDITETSVKTDEDGFIKPAELIAFFEGRGIENAAQPQK